MPVGHIQFAAVFNGGENLGAVTVDRVDDAAGLANGDGTEGVEVPGFLIFGGLLRGFCHGLE